MAAAGLQGREKEGWERGSTNGRGWLVETGAGAVWVPKNR